MMMLVAGSAEALERMRVDLPALCAAAALRAEFVPADATPPSAAALPFKLQTWAMDHPGLLQSVSHLLRSMEINIESAETTLSGAPMTGTPVFSMELILSVPASASIAGLREALARLCDEQNMDWHLTAL